MAKEDLVLQASLKALCALLMEAEDWASRYDKNGLSAQAVRNIRRDADRAYRASKRRLCVGLFGPSGAGKSFLIGELGRGGDEDLLISRPGTSAGPVPFLKNINPNMADEATAVVCRLTSFPQIVPERSGTFAARILSATDVLKCLATGFVYECKYPEVEGLSVRCEDLLEHLPRGRGEDPFLEVLDDAWSYVEERFDTHHYYLPLLRRADIRTRLGRIGGPLNEDQRRMLASTLWGMGDTPVIDFLYAHLMAALSQVHQVDYIEIDQDAVVSFGGEDEDETKNPSTVVNARILSDLMQGGYGTVPVYFGDAAGSEVPMEKATVSALVSELSLPVEELDGQADSRIVDVADILDFPGARTGRAGAEGESGCLPEKLQNDKEGHRNVVELFKRGKLTFLFEGYCREREITVLNFCIDGFERPECHDVVPQVSRWVETRYPRFDALEAEELTSPSLFLCLTKFDKLLQPAIGVGIEKRWDSTIQKIVSFFDRAGNSWFTNWGQSPGRCFDNLFWVRNPSFPIELEYLPEAETFYMGSQTVQRFMQEHKEKWRASVPADGQDRANTGIALLAKSILRKLRPEIKRRELEDKLAVMTSVLDEVLARHYVSVDDDERIEAGRKSARRLIALMRAHEEDCLFGPLLAALGLPPQIVRRQLGNMTEGVVPVLTSRQMDSFVEGLVQEWLEHVRKLLQKEDGLMRLISQDATTVTGFVEQLAIRAKSPAFREDFTDSIAFFFEHPLGLEHFSLPLTAVCCRKWSDFVTTLGYDLQLRDDPEIPPGLSRDVPWRRYMQQWEEYLEELYVANCSGEQEIPEGNDLLGEILRRLRVIGAGA
jgi:hypothetical protein